MEEALSRLGYRNRFREMDRPNPSIKRSLMRQFPETHDLSYCSKDGSIGIELLNHRKSVKNCSFIVPIIENIPDGFAKYTGDEGSFQKMFAEEFNASVLSMKNNASPEVTLNKLMVRTGNPSESIKFWECLGFKSAGETEDLSIMEFISPLSKKSSMMYLKTEKTGGKYFLDDDGFNCIAFVSNSSAKEKSILSGMNFRTTEIEQLRINGRPLNIFFAIGPCGELVEIVSL
ncbi:MAG: hypothetical protein NT118_08695 [Lentisphaerae bacterium]|nr:hypothetical protein [Lentisphaerota bacterium]